MSAVASNLMTFAEAYLLLGYSVIPVYGDSRPERPKAAAVAWSAFQSRHHTLVQAEDWFVRQGFAGIAIVTGRISNVVVLDFDVPDLFDAFRQKHPHLAETKIFQTRRGFHLYFQANYLPISSRKGQGVDLLGEGSYAVAYPTSIDGVQYQLVRGGMPRPLALQDLHLITAFIDQQRAAPAAPPAAPPIAVSSLSAAHMQRWYRAQVGEGWGRNETLFRAACAARDHGWSAAAVQTALVDLHTQALSGNHPAETSVQRQHEAHLTIQSAFSRPARPPRAIQSARPQMPTRVCEMLHALKLTCVVRTIEGLREKGIQPGQVFTRQQAYELLKGLVGRDSVHHALEACAASGEKLIAREETPPLEPPPAAKAAAKETPPIALINCVSESRTKPVKIAAGRKPRRYIMPSNSQLVHRLGIRFSSSDPLQPDDLRSAKKTRQAAHRELLRRRPGQYYRGWLGKRLGVSSRTTQRYDSELHVHVQPMFHQIRITWETLPYIPDEPIPGMFLMDDRKRRYPAKREIALSLLPKVRALYLMRQEANFYSLDEPHLAQVWKSRSEQQKQLEQRLIVEQGRTATLPPVPFHPPAQPPAGVPPPSPQPAAQGKPVQPTGQRKTRPRPAPKLTKRRALQPLPDRYQEALAQRVYNTLNERIPDPKQRISQASARRAVFTYGAQAVESALKCAITRGSIIKPVGFFMTLLRSGQKRGHV